MTWKRQNEIISYEYTRPLSILPADVIKTDDVIAWKLFMITWVEEETMITKPWFGPGPQNMKCENFRFLGWSFVISYLTSHFGQYKRNIKRGQANIDLQAIGSDTLSF